MTAISSFQNDQIIVSQALITTLISLWCSYLCVKSLCLFSRSASALFSSIHRCTSSSLSLWAWSSASFSLVRSERRATNSLDWHSMVNSKSRRAAFKLFFAIARVRASWRCCDTLEQQSCETDIMHWSLCSSVPKRRYLMSRYKLKT